jgi:hypothetical protein
MRDARSELGGAKVARATFAARMVLLCAAFGLHTFGKWHDDQVTSRRADAL